MVSMQLTNGVGVRKGLGEGGGGHLGRGEEGVWEEGRRAFGKRGGGGLGRGEEGVWGGGCSK